ncbi:hypothetical protein D3C78_1629920 [compost metagenome]
MPSSWSKRARQVLGTRSQLLSLPVEKVPAELVVRRRLPDPELRTLGWGVGLIQQEPGAADLHAAHQVNPEADRKNNSVKDREEGVGGAIVPHWRLKIAPLDQWSQAADSKTTEP